jgi:polysaccharide deacetylase family protein (PEP-CTERM system associated)
MLNALSVDVEDYFQVEAFSSCISPHDWDSFTPRVERNVARILDLFERHGVKATFFILGWVAQRFPQMIRRIADAGHEIGCHGYSHQNIMRQSKEEFRKDVREARNTLMDEIQKEVTCYRAPSFSITKRTLWAVDTLAEEGFTLDSSIFPIRHDLYGIPEAPRYPYFHSTLIGHSLLEFPPSTIRIGNYNLGVGGGGYLRLFPYCFSRRAIRHINDAERQPAMVYFHPWELDPDQPRISAKLRSQLRHYTNLNVMENKIEQLLQDFRFTTVTETVAQQIPYPKTLAVSVARR